MNYDDSSKMLELGVNAFRSGNYSEAKMQWENAAKLGNRYAINNLACLIYVMHPAVASGFCNKDKFIESINRLANEFNDAWAKLIKGIIMCGASHIIWHNVFGIDSFSLEVNPDKGIAIIEKVLNGIDKPTLRYGDYEALSRAYYEHFKFNKKSSTKDMALASFIKSIKFMEDATRNLPDNEWEVRRQWEERCRLLNGEYQALLNLEEAIEKFKTAL